jgi:uncharacterized protein YraI
MLLTHFIFVAAVTIIALTISTNAEKYLVKTDVNVRSKPSIKAKIVRLAKAGSYVDVTCQTTGDTVGGKNIWDKLSDGNYVFDQYIKTGYDGFSPNIKRCSGSGGGGGGGIPTIPPTKCKKHVINAGYVILEEFPGYVHTVWCYGKRPGDKGEHPKGLALDLMVKNKSHGREIAEWVMHNYKRLRVKYVIWGAKIWNPSRDKVTSWSNWRKSWDHWDHVHVSFNA